MGFFGLNVGFLGLNVGFCAGPAAGVGLRRLPGGPGGAAVPAGAALPQFGTGSLCPPAGGATRGCGEYKGALIGVNWGLMGFWWGFLEFIGG